MCLLVHGRGPATFKRYFFISYPPPFLLWWYCAALLLFLASTTSVAYAAELDSSSTISSAGHSNVLVGDDHKSFAFENKVSSVRISGTLAMMFSSIYYLIIDESSCVMMLGSQPYLLVRIDTHLSLDMTC